MKVHVHTRLCIICWLTFAFHQCSHCHEHNHTHSHNDDQISEAPNVERKVTEPETGVPVPAAEHEQKYYIEKLFERYGDKGRLSFYGLESLLANLGLGEVKVVEINHEEIGHDHVSHLDVLDVQEGKHSHSQDHLHSHSSLENQTVNNEATNKNISCDSQKRATVDSSLKLDHKHTHDHHHHNHHHRHNPPHHHQHVHNGTPHSHNSEAMGDFLNETIQSPTPLNEHENVSQGHAPRNENGHHNRKREAPHNENSGEKPDLLPASNLRNHGGDHQHEECLNVTQLLQYYGLGINSPISPDQFTYICPALLYQIDRRFCIKHYRELQVEDLSKDKGGASAWVCGLISITVISLLSLLGVILIPIINQGCFRFLLSFLVALAVGTLSGDALLHLLPHSIGGHEHGEEDSRQTEDNDHSHSHGAETESFLETHDPVMKGLVAIVGIYLLFIVEHCLRMFKHYKEKKGKQKWLKKTQMLEDATIGRKLSDHKLNRRSDAEWLQLRPLSGAEDSVVVEGPHNETELKDSEGQKEYLSKSYVSAEEDESLHHNQQDGSPHNKFHDGEHDINHGNSSMSKKYKQHRHKHSHHSHGHCHSSKDMKDTGIASIAWMVIMGDGMHNFSDGLAIGAAFSAGLTGGISTSVAVFCHELPHELGDFAVLINAGMTVKQAIVYNLLSAMMAYVGMLIGTSVGQYANTVTLWIFAITAGMFLYVALVDMLPEMLHGDVEKEENGFCAMGQFILQNLGLLLGFGLMLIIALYEDKIVFDFKL
ncbi:zinc transporter ZIP10 [Ambystoma mexicanum]|uniref:zinc transporter ZIP10 n=1 Tax=Ambystoma mexicanum TaxID=8296 RepID=UPI0037E77E7F